MQLSKFFTSLAFTFAFSALLVQADPISDLESIHLLFKREDKLPFDSLPAGNCTAPSACTNIAQPTTCHCNGVLTVCQNTQGQFCWGSQSLNQNSGCPSAPSPCSDSFNGEASCLCNSQAVLCVDQHNHYCYGTISASGGASSVSLASIPTGSQSAVSGSASSSGQATLPSAPIAGSESATASATATPSFATRLAFPSLQLGCTLLLVAVAFISSA